MEDFRRRGLYCRIAAVATRHFLKRVWERAPDGLPFRTENGLVQFEGFLREVSAREFRLTVPGWGRVHLRVNRRGPGFVAVTFVPPPS